jgi:P22 coat protein - gene protein 5
MPNTIVNTTLVGRETLRVASNSLKLVANMRKKLSDDFKVGGMKVGGTVGIRLPLRVKKTKGAALQPQAYVDTVVYVTITDQAHIDFAWSSREETLDLQDLRERVVQPAAFQLANTVEADGFARLYQDVPNVDGTPGTIPNVNSTYLNAGARLTNLAVPDQPRRMFINPLMRAAIANANLTLFNPPRVITELFEEAMFSGPALSWPQWYESANVFPHTVGPLGGTPLVNGASQTGSSLITDGWTAAAASRLLKGDVFTIAGVYAINPQAYRSTTQLQQFVVTQDMSSDGSGNLTIPIYPPIVVTGAYQTVDSSPANNAAITVVGAANTVTPQGLGFHPDAFCMASADLILPKSGQSSRVRMPGVGMSLRYWEDSDIRTDEHPNRGDVIYGFKATRPEFAVRIAS